MTVSRFAKRALLSEEEKRLLDETESTDLDTRVRAVMQLAGIDPATVDEDGWAFFREWDSIIRGMDTEELEALRECVQIMQEMTPAEREQLARDLHRRQLTVEEARATVLARLEAGEEPTGEELGDLLTVDKVTQYIFRRLWREITGAMEPGPERLELKPQGFVLAA